MSAAVISTWLLINTVSALLLPPLNLLIAALIGYSMRRRWPRLSATVIAGAFLLLVVLSTTAGSRLIIAPLENLSSPLRSGERSGTDAQAIVVLGGGRIVGAPEYEGRDVPRPEVLARLRYGAALHRKSQLPLLVTGGTPDGGIESEAALMARVLREDFSVPTRWIESESVNTAQNAELSAAMLAAAGVKRILLVTDAVHMPRARMIFRHHGLQVTPAATMFLSAGPLDPIDFVPSGRALAASHYGMHEWIGLLWYRLRFGSDLALAGESG